MCYYIQKRVGHPFNVTWCKFCVCPLEKFLTGCVCFYMLIDLTKLSSKNAVSIYPPPVMYEDIGVLVPLATLDLIKLSLFANLTI